MRELPILFKPEMHLAVRRGTKTQTRRIVKPQGAHMFPMLNQDKTPRGDWFISDPVHERVGRSGYRPKYQPGDRLYVKEGLRLPGGNPWQYSLDGVTVMPDDFGVLEEFMALKNGEYCNPLHMPKWAARTWLEVTEVRAERLNDISEEDAKAEGVEPWPFNPQQPMTTGELGSANPYRGGFAVLWDDIHDEHTWKSSPWVWAYTFKLLEAK